MIYIEIPDNIAAQLRLHPGQIESQLRKELAVHLVREAICTSAQGACIAQMPRLAFEHLLGERKIPWGGTIEEVINDMNILEECI